jgi:hypothetical protein
MTWEFYEVWSVDSDGHEELVDTTRDVKEAKRWAEEALTQGHPSVIIYRETEDGELEEFEVLGQ